MTAFDNHQRTKPFKAILSHLKPKLTQSAPTLVSNSPNSNPNVAHLSLPQGQASLLDFNYEKTKRTQTLKSVKIYALGIRVNICHRYPWLKLQNEPNFPRFQSKNKDYQKNEPISNPNMSFSIENLSPRDRTSKIENYKTNPNLFT
jgi:hypothetical protein